MHLALVGALLLAPLYWLVVPEGARRDVITLTSLGALAWYDWRLATGLVLLVGLLWLCLWTLPRLRSPGRRLVACSAFALLAALFIGNKLTGDHYEALASQGGLAFLGVSYWTLKMAAAMADRARGGLDHLDARELLAWIVFLPTYVSGPIEQYDHFRGQQPRAVPGGAALALERILLGLVKALLFSHYLGQWAQPILADPLGHSWAEVLLANYAFTLRFYFDFSGYSDIAIGLAAIYGIDIQENFDRPLLRRNIVLLWQHWHMTLTGWLRAQLFVPISRMIMRRGGPAWDTVALVAAQMITMTFCGLWHGLSWNFALWGMVQAFGLVWVGIIARALGRRLPRGAVAWWRNDPLAHGVSVALTFHFFSFSNVLLYSSLAQATLVLRRLMLSG